MKHLIPLVFAAFFAVPLGAQTADAPSETSVFAPVGTEDLDQFLWKKRPVLVFADSENDLAFIDQIAMLKEREGALAERDVVVLVDTDPAARSALRLKMRPRGFMLVLMTKDGKVEIRKPFPWDVREITRSIDKMTIRMREIKDANAVPRD